MSEQGRRLFGEGKEGRKNKELLIQKLLGTIQLGVRSQETLLGDQKQISFF